MWLLRVVSAVAANAPWLAGLAIIPGMQKLCLACKLMKPACKWLCKGTV